MGIMKSAPQMDALTLQTRTQTARGWAHLAVPARAPFQGAAGASAEEALESPGPSCLLAWVQPGRSRQSSGLNILGGQAGISCLSRGELYLYADASRAPAIRNFIGCSDLGLLPRAANRGRLPARPAARPALFRLTAAEMNII